jgi:hypothetical protein
MKKGYLSVQSTYITIYSLIYIHCNLFDQKKVFGELTSVCRQQRLLCTCGRAVAVTTEEEAGPSDVDGGGGNRHTSGVDGGRGDRRSRERWSRERERWGLRVFWDEKGNNMGWVDIYRFKNIRSSFKLEPLLIVLESELKRF